MGIIFRSYCRVVGENVKDVKVIKLYEEIPETVGMTIKNGSEVIDKVVALKPDLIIGSQAD